jgi:hypothetical protein
VLSIVVTAHLPEARSERAGRRTPRQCSKAIATPSVVCGVPPYACPANPAAPALQRMRASLGACRS